MKQNKIKIQSTKFLKVLFALPLLLINNPSSGQNNPANHIHTQKSATYDYETGQGIITIESYVDGEITKIPFSKAADLVMVLDVSNSMCPNNPNDHGVESLGQSVYLFNGDKIGYLHLGTSATDNNLTTHDYKTVTTINNHSYLRYTVQLGGTGTMYNLAYFVKNTKYGGSSSSNTWKGDTGWYYGSSTTLTQSGTGASARWQPYKAGSTDISDVSDKIYTDVKLDILENACRELIELIYENPAEGTGIGHRISIVTWADNNDGNAQIHYINRGLTPTTAANKDALINDVTFLETGPNTYAKRGLDKAMTNLNSSSSDREKLIVFFTDGEPNNKFADIVNSAKALKDKGAKIFSIALVADDTATASRWNQENTMQIKTYLEYVSSLYPSATGTIKSNKSTITPGTKNTDGKEYYRWSQTGADLADAFKQAGMSLVGGAGLEDMDASDGVHMVDKINNDFFVLAGADASLIKTYTANCSGKDGNGALTFADKVEDKTLTVTADATSNPQSVNVDGFNYSENWCGPDASAGDDAYHGKKLIVEIPFKIKAPGDETFDIAKTNAAGSSLYRGADPIDGAAFPVPEIPFTEITIQKYGLKTGESAVYIVKKDNVEITRIILTGKDSNGSMVSIKLRILNPDVTYSVSETAWDYTYTLTSSDVSDNVFKFYSSKKNGMDNTTEDRKVNDFK